MAATALVFSTVFGSLVAAVYIIGSAL